MAKVVSLSTFQTPTRHGQQHEPALPALTESLFVGREREMAALHVSLADAVAGHGRLVLLVGDPGIGKTRTAQELAAHARRQGAQVFSGRCHESAGSPPFWPWVRIVRAYLHECSLTTLRADLGAGASDIAEILAEVRERLPKLPPAPSLEPEQARFRFFDSFTTFLKNVAHAQPLVVILDDLHWADASSLLLLQFLARELADAPLFILGTYRDVDLDLQHPLRQTLGELARASGSQTLHLRGLAQPEVAQVLHHYLTGVSPEEALISAVHQQTEGNPFFLTEVVRLLASEEHSAPLPTPQSANPLPIPPRVMDVLSRRLARLSGECLRVLTLASVIGRDFTLAVLTRASELPPPQILHALEEAIAAQIVTADPQTLSSYSFAHALMRETMYRELTLTQRMTLHHQVGAALESLRDADLTPHLTELAYHFGMAAQGGTEVEKALTYATRAGEHATRSLAYEEAIPQYHRALHLLTLLQPPDELKRGEVLLALGDAYRRVGQSEQAKATFLEAATSARQRHHARHLAQAALGFAGLWVTIGTVDETVVAFLEEALRALGEEEDILRARLYARLAVEFWFSTSREQRVTFSQQAVRLARRTADQKTLGYCLQAHHLALWGSPQVEEQLATTVEILRLADQAGDLELALHVYSRRVADLLAVGDVVALEAVMATHARMAEQSHQPAYVWFSVIFQAMRSIRAGHFEEGERLAQQALMLGQRAQVSRDDAVVGFGIQLFALRREQGRLSEMEPAVNGFIEQYPVMTIFRCARVYLYSEIGKEAEARQQFEELASRGFTDLPQDLTLPLSLAFLAQVCAFLGDTGRAAQLYALLSPYTNYNVAMGTGMVHYGPASHFLGLLATVLGQWDEAQRHFTAALAMNTQLGARPRLADTQCAYADLLLTRQQAGDQEQALALLDAALATAQELGMAGLQAKAENQKSKVKSQKSKVKSQKF